MKDFILPVGLLVVFGGGVWLYTNGYLTDSHPYVAPAPTVITEPDPPKKPERKKPTPPAPRPSAEIPPPSPDPVRPQTVLQAKRFVPQGPSFEPIPDAALLSVKKGMQGTSVVEMLGKPVLTTLTTDHGSVKEIYVYARRPGQPFARIYLLDGKVTAAGY